MSEKVQTDPSTVSEVPLLDGKPFEPQSSGSASGSNPPPLIVPPPFDGGDEDER
jgi:hypothetical protein